MPSRELISSEEVFSGKIFRVSIDEVRIDGEQVQREVVHHPGAVGIVAVDAGRVVLVNQYRHPVAEELWEIPAGKLDVPGEDPRDCAARELEEETGYRADELVQAGSFYNSPGYSDERFLLFAAPRVTRVTSPPRTDEDEVIDSRWWPAQEAVERARSFGFRDAKTLLGLSLVLPGLTQGR